MNADDVQVYEVIGDGVLLAYVGCRACGELWLAQAYVTTLRSLECPACGRQQSMALDAFPSLHAYLKAYAGFPRLHTTH